MANIQNNKLKLEEHQEKAYKNVEKLFGEKGKAAVIFPTGCGKSFVVLKYILEHPDERILFLSPRNAIKDQMYEYIVRFIGGDFRPIEEIQAESGNMKNAAKQYIPNIECMLYQTIMGIDEKDNIDELITRLNPDVIVIDEMHHLKTSKETSIDDDIENDIDIEEDEVGNDDRASQENKWGQKFKRLLKMCPQAKLLGLSATPIRNDGANVVERLFEDAIADEISLLEAIEAGIIYPPKYVVPDFIREDELESLLEKINSVEDERKEELKAEYDELVKKSDKANGIPDLLKENIIEQDGKYIIFCKDIEDMKDKMSKAKEWFGEIDGEPEIYGIHSKDNTSSKQLQTFNNSSSKHLKLMYCVGMIDEGVHLNNISGVILAAKTGSRPTYLQRIGRAISSGRDKKQSLVIDLVNNNEILADEHNTQYGYEISDLEALEKLVDWIENQNDGKWPEYAEDKSTKEKAMARRLARINNKYLKYVENSDLLEELNEDSIDEIQQILQLGKTIGMFENFITIDFGNNTSNGIDVSIDNFLHGIEIKGVRRDFREILDHDYINININMQNYEEYKAWCEEHNKKPHQRHIRAAIKRDKETEEQRENRLCRARYTFFTKIKEKEELSEEEKKLKRLYEELDEVYKEKSVHMQNYEEYKTWCEEHARKPRSKNVIGAKKREEENEDQKENRLATARANFFLKRREQLTQEEEKIKKLYEELDEQYIEKSTQIKNYEEYKAWCDKHQRLPKTSVNGVIVKAAQNCGEETEEQIEVRLSRSRSYFDKKIDLSEEEEKIKLLYAELDEKYKEKNVHIKNYEEYKTWCAKNGRLPRTQIVLNGERVKKTKKGEKETEEQIEQRIARGRTTFFSRERLTEEEKKIKILYEELDELYKEKSVQIRNYEEYKVWCEENGREPRKSVYVKGKRTEAVKEGEKETEKQREQRLGLCRESFLKKIKSKNKLSEEEVVIKRLYEELDELYKEKSVQIRNYEEYEEWCKEYGKLPRTCVKVNGKSISLAKDGEKETEEQREQRLGSYRSNFFKRKIKGKKKLTEEEEEIKRLYEELDELYGKKQPARNIAPTVRNVSIGESQEANEFIEGITSEQTKEGVTHNDE